MDVIINNYFFFEYLNKEVDEIDDCLQGVALEKAFYHSHYYIVDTTLLVFTERRLSVLNRAYVNVFKLVVYQCRHVCKKLRQCHCFRFWVDFY